MVRKPFEAPPPESLEGDPFRKAGVAAEREMAFHLHRAFGDMAGVFLLHGLRFEDATHREFDGSPRVAQIDHLLLHRNGAFIIESKSVSTALEVGPDGHGGDLWCRVRNGTEFGMASPIKQAALQGEALRAVLQEARASLLGRQPIGMRTISKFFAGTDQRGFSKMPIQIVVAISTHGHLRQLKGWQPPSEPFPTYVLKADQVADQIRGELDRHRGKREGPTPDYGLWWMHEAEVEAVADFLLARHVPAPPPHRATNQPPTAQPNGHHATARCPACSGTALDPRAGRYGPYWHCTACGKNTAMPQRCGACGHDGKANRTVTIRVVGPDFIRHCTRCGIDERIATTR